MRGASVVSAVSSESLLASRNRSSTAASSAACAARSSLALSNGMTRSTSLRSDIGNIRTARTDRLAHIEDHLECLVHRIETQAERLQAAVHIAENRTDGAKVLSEQIRSVVVQQN